MRAWVVVAVVAGCRSAPAPAPAPFETHGQTAPQATERHQKTVITDTHVEILDPIRFLVGSPTLDPRSTPTLDAIASTLAGNPSIRLVEVHAYGADTLAQFQARVGADRAQAIVDALVARGVDGKRLLAAGSATPPAGRSAIPVFEIVLRTP
jgi:outer membrane protein OmpA-like peptidoglycan-associated protein